MKKLGVVLFAKLTQLVKDIGEAVGIIESGNKKMQESSKKVSKSIEKAFGQGAKAGIKSVSEELEIQRDIYRDMEEELKRLEALKAKTAKFDFRRQAELSTAINKVKTSMADQKDIIEVTANSKKELNQQLAAGRSRAEENAQAMEALGRAVNATAMATLLLGDDNKKLQPAINAVRVVMAGASAAMALYNLSLRENGILTTLSTKLQRTFIAVAGTGTAAMQTFRVALASTGIGVLVVALGALIGKMMEATDGTNKLNDALKQTERDNEFTKNSLEDTNDAIDRVTQQQILLAKIAGKTEREIQAIREEAYRKTIANLEKEIDSEFEADAERQRLNNANIKDADERNKANIESFAQYSDAKRSIENRITAIEQQAVIERLQIDLDEKTKKDEARKKETEKRRQELEKQLKDYIEYQKVMSAEGVKLQQMLINKMADGKAKELKQLEFDYKQELAAVQYNNALKREITEKYNKDVNDINTKYRQLELKQIGENVTAYVKGEEAKRNARQKLNQQQLAEQNKINEQLNQLTLSSVEALAAALGGVAAGNPMSDLFKVMGVTFANFLETIGRGMIALSGIAEAFKTLALTGVPALVAGVGLIAAAGFVKASINNTPKFAKGGIVSGPTLGLMGEYPGASSNPEVIAPLDKLKSMLGGTADGGGFVAETRVSGRDLAIVLNRYNKEASRT